ncbi:DNA gyrase/topoisomerase IV subunit A [Luteibaculum oceani]|uniref:DNA gyrase/topoisomerase IV subunit A n=1 Tax=Luteibaculum oceani TaxID=1294296 RepID=A0A5C6UTZ1_9FLAO|nr:DNA gyrase/topoisomerase IV subunit A [Luteibaculum oceani]TXC76060.1 DNA gyrase/topoisomerase IV subunit A [Luteibaculum oceani]
MSEEINQNEDHESNNVPKEGGALGQVIPVSGLYKDWFLDYASYVILERAVPALQDGLKPVQRRILHSMDDLDDGRYNKVANIIGHTMKYHPHGDASIGDALVQLGQKELLIDCQGNWGNILTGDSAAAPRYIEARLSPFAKEVVFNPKTTDWQLSYDGRNREPINLPVKFPLLLAQGAEGIAVGMACKILPHNFNELIDASVSYLKGKSFTLVPDFPTGGMADVSNYNDGLRGGRVRVRAKIKKEDKRTLSIVEIPFGTNTSSLIESIIKANDKGKIKIKKIEDNTAEHVEILVHLHNDVSPDQMIDALYAFTDCEMSLAPNAAVIENNEKPNFMSVSEMLKRATDGTVALLKLELEIRLNELQEQWHFSSLEKIFIENRIYRDIEECETWEAVLSAIDKGLKPHTKHLLREVTEEDIVRLTEIKIKRISKFDSFKADEAINKLEDAIAEVKNHLAHLIDYAIDYYQNIKKKYGKGRERKTELRQFDTIEATRVVVSNRKLYVDREEGFVGYGLKKAEFVDDCSDIDDVIVFRRNGSMLVSKVQDKAFFGKDIIHVGIWKKGDDRTIYNMVYQDGKAGPSMMKRFAVTSITRDKEYDLTAGSPGSKVLYFTANPNGEAEILNVLLRPRPHLKKLRLEINFADLAIKGRGAKGNILTKHLISKISQKESLGSTLDAREIWYDDTVKRLNDDERGRSLGKFRGNDKILVVYQKGYYKLYEPTLTTHFDEGIFIIEKFDPSKVATVVYYDGKRENYYLKRFELEENDKENYVISEEEGSEMTLFTFDKEPKLTMKFDKRSGAKVDEEEVLAHEFIAVKGMKALGNKLTGYKIKELISEETYVAPEPEDEGDTEVKEGEDQPSLF